MKVCSIIGRGGIKVKSMYTGFPGFIASQLIREQLKDQKEHQIYAIVLQSELNKAEVEKEALQEQFPQLNLELLVGDITKSNLGLSNEHLNIVLEEVEVFWHLAAIYDLAVKREIAYKVNVEGTKNVNDFVTKCAHLKRYMYFSTAYVAGTRTGNLLETELIRPESFKNYYEETKFEAELLVEQLKKSVPVTIIRPGIVRGHSKTGETIKFDGPYFLLNMVDRLKGLPFIPYIGRSKSTLNTVPVDYIFEAATYLSTAEKAIGKTVHLTDPKPHPIQEIVRAITFEVTGRTPKGTLPLNMTKFFMKNKQLQKVLGVEYESLDYFSWDAEFDTSVIEELLKESNIECADFIDSLPQMAKFYEENKHKKDFHIKIQ